jgi:hypothetical protein
MAAAIPEAMALMRGSIGMAEVAEEAAVMEAFCSGSLGDVIQLPLQRLADQAQGIPNSSILFLQIWSKAINQLAIQAEVFLAFVIRFVAAGLDSSRLLLGEFPKSLTALVSNQ